MPIRLRRSASNTVPGRFIAMKAKYPGQCSCGKLIKVGEIIYFDPQAKHPTQCQPCGRQNSEVGKQMLVKESPVSEEQYIVGRANQLRMLAASRRKSIEVELAILMRRLQTDLIHSRRAQAFWLNLACITFPFADFILMDNVMRTTCANCHKKLAIGVRILYCRKSHRYLCLVCQPEEFKNCQYISQPLC
jgi:hypothetical protein